MVHQRQTQHVSVLMSWTLVFRDKVKVLFLLTVIVPQVVRDLKTSTPSLPFSPSALLALNSKNIYLGLETCELNVY